MAEGGGRKAVGGSYLAKRGMDLVVGGRGLVERGREGEGERGREGEERMLKVERRA